MLPGHPLSTTCYRAIQGHPQYFDMHIFRSRHAHLQSITLPQTGAELFDYSSRYLKYLQGMNAEGQKHPWRKQAAALLEKLKKADAKTLLFRDSNGAWQKVEEATVLDWKTRQVEDDAVLPAVDKKSVAYLEGRLQSNEPPLKTLTLLALGDKGACAFCSPLTRGCGGGYTRLPLHLPAGLSCCHCRPSSYPLQ
eukprot:GHVU01135582.1.p1 GENE.GHVU01135582.1~~GHVU01135582.1.p1  ORF type:complete len:194 (+),score=10.85 GHVU01135582.1:572-1153(+)